MTTKPAANPIVDYIIQSERNLKIAQAVFNEWENARQAVLRAFFTDMGDQLHKKLPNWLIDYSGPFFMDRYGAFSMTKANWSKEYYVRLECPEYGQKPLIFGIWRHEDVIGRRPFSSEIIPALQEALPAVKSRKWWEAVVEMHSPASVWRPAEVLWKIRDDEVFRDDVVAQLLEVARISEKIIDKLAAQSKWKK